jgi:imidazole glycerol-phosphate synthase subunit HisH
VSTALIDYGSGNLRSCAKALAVAGARGLVVTADPDAVAAADRIVLPGVGAFADCARNLRAVDGLLEALEQSVRRDGVPFLGICVGMQLLADRGVEFETSEGLGWIPGETNRLEPGNPHLKVPHMGWNEASPATQPVHRVLQAAWGGREQDVYFVHSFAFRAKDPAHVAATASYGADSFAAAVARDNILGVQFHPEKSQSAGLSLLEAWLKA